MDAILRLLVTVAIYFVVFAVIGIVFYEVDKRFKMWMSKHRARCTVCNTRLDAELVAAGGAICPSCSQRRALKRPVRRSARRRA